MPPLAVWRARRPTLAHLTPTCWAEHLSSFAPKVSYFAQVPPGVCTSLGRPVAEFSKQPASSGVFSDVRCGDPALVRVSVAAS